MLACGQPVKDETTLFQSLGWLETVIFQQIGLLQGISVS
jgi:hypothetical protein